MEQDDNGMSAYAVMPEIFNASKGGNDSLKALAQRYDFFSKDTAYVVVDYARSQSNRHGREFVEKAFKLYKFGAGCAISGGWRCVAGIGAESLGAPVASRADLRQEDPGSWELYKDSLRRGMEKPIVQDADLKRIIDKLYRDGATVGSGSSADAVRQEDATGLPVGGAFHAQKVSNDAKAIERWLANKPNAAASDRAVAENVLRDMNNSLGR